MNITDEKFAEVIKSLTQEDFDAVQNIVEQLTNKFDNHETKGMFTENEIQNVSKLIDSNSQEVLIGVLITKFKERKMLSDYDKGLFTPDCLVGVETNKGFIISVVEIEYCDFMKPAYYVYTTESLPKEDLYDVHNIKFFISDDNDETVSFREYIGMFYEG